MNKQQTEMKEYLSQAFRIDQRIQSKMEQVASLNDLATRATATYSDMPGSETRNLHRMEDAILSIIELEAEINGDICKLVQTKKDIVHKIKAVQNTEYQTLWNCGICALSPGSRSPWIWAMSFGGCTGSTTGVGRRFRNKPLKATAIHLVPVI